MNDFLLELDEGEGSFDRACAEKEMEDFFRSSCGSSDSSSSYLSNAKGGGAGAAGRGGGVRQESGPDRKEWSTHDRRQRNPSLPVYLLSLPKKDMRWGDVRGTDGCAR